MATARDILRDLFSQVDASLVGGIHAAVSVRPDAVRRWLRTAGRPFVDVGLATPDARALEDSARWVVEQSRFKLTLVGGLAGLGGAVSVPPEAVASTIALLRLAQRLAIVYGFDPGTDRGELAVWRAVAAGFELDLPGEGPVGMKVTDVPGVMVKGAHARYPTGALATAVLRESVWQIGRRLTRLMALPVVSSGVAAMGAHKRSTEIGARMAETLRRLSDAPAVDPGVVQEAIEVG